jgi:hypothetical protein
VLSLVCSNVRNCTIPSSKLRTLDLLLALAVHLTDEAKLDRLVPYVIDLLHDEAAVVRAAGVRALTQVVGCTSQLVLPACSRTLWVVDAGGGNHSFECVYISRVHFSKRSALGS